MSVHILLTFLTALSEDLVEHEITVNRIQCVACVQ
jgi:hypothetical protein